MNPRHVIGSALAVAAVAVLSAAGFSLQDGGGAPSADEAAMMARWMEFAAPGAGHRALDSKVGEWTSVSRMCMAPGAPPTESTGKSTIQWIMGGRCLEERVTSWMNGMPFEGLGHIGYDTMKQRYVGTWLDNMGTGIAVSDGAYDTTTRTFEYSMEMPDPMLGKYVKCRMVETATGADHFTAKMFCPGPDGGENLVMELEYTRAR